MKSFSQLTKEELAKREGGRPCCDRAEFAGLLLWGGTISRKQLSFGTENKDVFSAYIASGQSLGLDRLMEIGTDKSGKDQAEIYEESAVLQILSDLRMIDGETGLVRYHIDPSFIQEECCCRAMIRGAFLGGGTVINPQKNYNLEFVTPYLGLSREMEDLLRKVGFSFKRAIRKSKYVLYLKNSEHISDFLSYMGAFRAQMELLNVKIEKEIRNDFNRAANSETANLVKSINASVEQVRAIEAIRQSVGLDKLPEDLQEVARLRLAHKDLTLSELGALMNPPLSKSGVNHRLKKLMQYEKKE